MPIIAPHLWYDKEAEQAAELYTSVFPDSSIKARERSNRAGKAEEAIHFYGSLRLKSSRFTVPPISGA